MKMTKNTLHAFLLFLLLSASLSFSQGLWPVGLSYNWLSGSWETLSILALLISLFVVALAYMASISLDLPQLKAWAGAELSQVFVTALIIIALVAVFGFTSAFTMSLVDEGDFNCYPQVAEPYTVSVAKCYMDSLIVITNTSMKETSRDALKNAKKASERDGKSTNSIYTLWYAYFTGKNAGYSLYTDRFSYDFEVLSGIYTSLYAQRVFLERIVPPFTTPPTTSLASVLLFYGVVLRTFFFSRKLGGLLLAIGIALLLVWPALYAFSWFTLKVAVFGDQMVAAVPEDCPDECLLEPPKTYLAGIVPTPCDALHCGVIDFDYLYKDEDGILVSATDGTFSCPTMCRELPYPVQNPGCTKADLTEESTGNIAIEVDVRDVCKTCPDECKVGGRDVLGITDPDNPAVPYRERTTCYLPSLPTPDEELLFGEVACEKTNDPDIYNSASNPDGTNTYLSSCYTEGCAIKYSAAYNSQSCYNSCIGSGGVSNPICPDFCRVYYYAPDDPTNTNKWRVPTSADVEVPAGQEKWTACDACNTVNGAGAVPTFNTCPANCRFGMPDPERLDCDKLCDACPTACRIQGLATSTYFGTNCAADSDCSYSETTHSGCPEYCKLVIPPASTPISGEICDAGGFCLDGSICNAGDTCLDRTPSYSCPSASGCTAPSTCQQSVCPGSTDICNPESECQNNQICPPNRCTSTLTCAPYTTSSTLPTQSGNPDCNACPQECRVKNPTEFGCPSSCLDTGCAPECKSSYSPDSLFSLCDSCLNCDDDCAAIPQIRTNCVERCNLASAASKDFTPAGFVSSGGAQTTMADVKNVGMLAIPAIVLPLFNIVITIAFIRILSQTLGGDVEIPGLARII